MNKIWQLKPKKFGDVVSQLLYNRGILGDKVNLTDVEKFLNPDFVKDFFAPKLLPDFPAAIKRIKAAISGGEKIGIYADYDADGIPGAALLYRTLQKLGCKLEIYIPTRASGYGFNQAGIDYLIDCGCKLIISVDLGIREVKFAKYISGKKVDLIITDHHEPGEELPKALAVVNPKRKDSKYPFRELCGAGVVFKVVQGLAEEYSKIIDEKFLKWNLDLVAISTISDVVPLISENRTIAKFGLLVLRKTNNIGLQELYKVSAIDERKIDAYTVGFQIGPRINAPGRFDHATASFKLLVSEDKKEAEEAARHLQGQNEKRQVAMEEIFTAASKIIDREKLFENKIIIVSHKDWQKGVIGPVASRLVEKYFCPVIILSESDDTLDGSCRSTSAFNITEALSSAKKYLISFGGHVGAAGLHLKKKNYDSFVRCMINYANKNISARDLLPKITIDLELGKNRIGIGLFKDLEQLEPFGFGNPKPVFLSRKMRLIFHRVVGKGNNHLQLKFTDGIKDIKGVLFSHDKDLNMLKTGNLYDIVYNPGFSFWNGKNYLDLRIIDFKLSENDEQKK